MIVPTLRVVMHPVTLCVTRAQMQIIAKGWTRSVPGGIPTQIVGTIMCLLMKNN